MLELFITATDTDAGKTYVAQLFTLAFVKNLNKVAVFKPISAGCNVVNGQFVNEDAQQLRRLANCNQTIADINPIAFEPPIAPHIAAAKANQVIDIKYIKNSYQKTQQLNADVVITEGAGGWRLPIGNGQYLSEFAQQIKAKVILVVNMKLGCLNHAVLTYETILSEAGIELTDEDESEPDIEKELEQLQPKKEKPAAGSEKLKNATMDKLKEMLEKAIEQEDYEKAAKVRDEINNRN